MSTASPRAFLELDLTEAGAAQLHLGGRENDPGRISAEPRRRLIDLMVMLRPWMNPGGVSATGPPPMAAASHSTGSTAGASAPSSDPAAPAIANTRQSLVGQLDSVLLARLAGTPLAENGIRLAESLHVGAIVFVGSRQYDGVDQVPDTEIRRKIRAAIAEWEDKYTPR